MSWKTAAALVVLVAGLGGYYAYDTYWLGPRRDKAEQARGRLWEVEPSAVEAVTLKRKAETVRLKRVEGGWEMLEPVKARADRGAADGVVTTLATLRVDREIDPNPARPAEFGLDPPEAEVILDVKGRAEPLALALGGKNPTGAWVYAREKGKSAVVALSETAARDVNRPVAELRDRTVLAFERGKVTAVEVQGPEDGLVVEAREGGAWQITKPRPYRADTDFMAEFLDRLDRARVKEFVEEAPAALGPYGLDRPTTITLWIGKDKERSSRILHLGKVDGAKKGVYVKRAGEPGVMLAPEELWNGTPRTVATLRDKVVVAYAYDKLVRVSLEHARGAVTLEREGSTWKITAPEALKADAGSVNSLLWAVRDLRARGFLADEAAAIGRYLARPEVTLRLWEEGAQEPKVLLLGSSRETRGGQPAAVAAVAGQGPVVLVDAKALRDLARTAGDLRDKTLLPAFELGDVRRVRLAAGDVPLVVERKDESEWRVLEPSKGAAKEARVVDLILTLKALRWKAIVGPGGEDLARFGLDAPRAEVTLAKGDGAEIATLVVGRVEGEMTYVRLKATPTVYSVETKALGDLRKASGEIQG